MAPLKPMVFRLNTQKIANSPASDHAYIISPKN
jgi:hypothetical protein